MNTITVRKMGFEFPEKIDPVFVEGDPGLSSLIVGTSMVLPYLEPYLMRSVRKASKQVTDPDVQQDMLLFCSQEGNHFKEHIKANDVLRKNSDEPEVLAALEAQLDADYKNWTSNRSLKWNLAYAEGFEAFTSTLALLFFEERVCERMSSPMRELSEWHLLEELEHRTVAFDAYEHAAGGYLFKIAVALFAQWHLLSYTWRFSKLLRCKDEELLRECNAPQQRRGRRKWHARLLLKLTGRVLKTYLPWYTPRKLRLPPELAALGNHYSQMAVSHS